MGGPPLSCRQVHPGRPAEGIGVSLCNANESPDCGPLPALLFALPLLPRFLLTRPNEPMEISGAGHSRIINSTVSAIGALSGTLKSDLQGLLERSQSLRELFSYRFPATGLAITKEKPSSEETFLSAHRLAELAELNSECLASALAKHCTGEFKVDWHQLADLCGYETPKHELDRDDYHRLGYLSRTKLPSELMYIARPGLIEDFFLAWSADKTFGLPEHAFDPEQGYGPSLFTFV